RRHTRFSRDWSSDVCSSDLNAIHLIHNEVGFVTQASAIYETPSWGFSSFPFYNMCLLIHTHLLPQNLLIRLKEIEKKLGREKKRSEERRVGKERRYSRWQ